MKTLTRASSALFLAAAAMLPNPASAYHQPEQTPENAQRFLALLFPAEYQYQLDGIDHAFTERRTSDVHSGDANCRTNWRNGRTDGQTESFIDWRRVLEVRQHGSAVVVTERNPHDIRVTFTFNLGADAAAARATYAMEFLRQHCDPAASTGF